jgi:hypothetical protein
MGWIQGGKSPNPASVCARLAAATLELRELSICEAANTNRNSYLPCRRAYQPAHNSASTAEDLTTRILWSEHGRRTEGRGQQALCRQRFHRRSVSLSGAMCIQLLTDVSAERSSPKPLKRIPRIMSSTRIDPVHMPHSKISTRHSKTPTRPQRSSRTGRKDGDGRVQLFTVWAISSKPSMHTRRH